MNREDKKSTPILIEVPSCMNEKLVMNEKSNVGKNVVVQLHRKDTVVSELTKIKSLVL